MQVIVPEEGIIWFASQGVDPDPDDYIYEIAIGTGSPFDGDDDTELGNEVYRSGKSQDNASIELAGGVGEIRYSISVAGGLEVEANTEVTEVAVYTSKGTCVFAESREPILIDSGERVRITGNINTRQPS